MKKILVCILSIMLLVACKKDDSGNEDSSGNINGIWFLQSYNDHGIDLNNSHNVGDTTYYYNPLNWHIYTFHEDSSFHFWDNSHVLPEDSGSYLIAGNKLIFHSYYFFPSMLDTVQYKIDGNILETKLIDNRYPLVITSTRKWKKN